LNRRLDRVVVALGSVLALCAVGWCADVTPGSSPGQPVPKLLRLSVGETVPIAGEENGFERVLLMPPAEESTTPANAWEISADTAIKLARLPKDERWRAIRRNLGLAPGDSDDLILWSEVADAVLDSIAKLPLEQEPGGQAFGLRVAFPGKDTSDPPPDVALVFSNTEIEPSPGKQFDAESALKNDIADALTGVEGFVEFADDGASAPSPEELAGIEVQLLDSGKQLVAVSPVRQGYFCFPRLPVDPDFGSDYYVAAAMKGEGPAGLDSLHPDVAGASKAIYVPVMRGIRSRVRLTIPRPSGPFRAFGEKGIQTQDWAISGGPAALLLQEFVEGSSVLGIITQRLPANPGLHLGVVQVPDSGPKTFWSSRFVLRPPALDRGPQFVARGKMRIQCLTVEAEEGPARRHYVKMMWLAHATIADLRLASRRVSETPWGIGIGVAPSADPALYVVGASYKLVRTAELLAGVGFQEGRSGSFVYGLTLDMNPILDGIFGKSKDSGE